MYILDDISEDRCNEAFINHSEDSCILYDDDRCDGEEGLKAMRNGASLMNVVKLVDFDVESWLPEVFLVFLIFLMVTFFFL